MVRWTTLIRTVTCLMLVLVAAACDEDPMVVCLEPRPAILVTVEHAETGAPIGGALVIARDGTYTDSERATVGDNGAVAGLAWGRPGTYQVQVEKAGFAQ